MKILNTRYDPAVPIAALSMHPENPREGDVGGIVTSIEANGFYGALVVQESTGRILAGNHRARSVAEVGGETAPVIYVECDDMTARKIMLADNRLSDIASNDEGKLKELLMAIAAEDTLEGTGFDGDDLDDLINGAAAAEKSSASPGDPGEERYKEQYGVIVICADATEQESVFNRLAAEGLTCRIVVT